MSDPGLPDREASSLDGYPQSLADVTAAVLAGGLGTRLRSVVSDQPKVLAEVAGKPFLAHLLNQLAEADLKTVVLCTGYLGEQVEAAFGGSFRSMQLKYSREPAPCGTAGALRRSLDFISSEWILAMNGDSYCGANLQRFWSLHRERRAWASMVLTEKSDARQFGRIALDESGRVLEFLEKSDQSGATWINAGIYLFRRDALEPIPLDRAVSLEREMFPQWVPIGVYGYQSDSPFIDIGTPESYADAQGVLAGIG